jgi:hypothetical protein
MAQYNGRRHSGQPFLSMVQDEPDAETAHEKCRCVIHSGTSSINFMIPAKHECAQGARAALEEVL